MKELYSCFTTKTYADLRIIATAMESNLRARQPHVVIATEGGGTVFSSSVLFMSQAKGGVKTHFIFRPKGQRTHQLVKLLAVRLHGCSFQPTQPLS